MDTTAVPQKPPVSLTRLTFQSLNELWVFQMIDWFILSSLVSAMGASVRMILASKGVALTTANLKTVLLSWQGAAVFAIILVVMLLYLALDLFARIYFCDDILQGRQGGVIRRAVDAVRRSVRALPRFFCLSGLPTLFYILLLVPIVGVGFSIGLTRQLYIPHFISEVIFSTPLYFALYVSLALVLGVMGVLHVFVLHGVLLEGLSPREARIKSRTLVRSHPWRMLGSFLHGVLVTFLVTFVSFIAFTLVYGVLDDVGEVMPNGYRVSFKALLQSQEPTDLDFLVMGYRMVCYFVAFISTVIASELLTLTNAYVLLIATHLYRWLGNQDAQHELEPARYPRRTGRRYHVLRILSTLGITVQVALFSILCGLVHDDIVIHEEPVGVVAHRLGGITATENSMEGLENAVDLGCYGAETDVQRTLDGHYVINHDDTFSRLCGVKAAPQDLTLDQVMELHITDRVRPSIDLRVLTLEEVLDASKGRIKLFIELKGATADQQMVDDVVRMVRERDMVGDVALISLSYDAISYAEEAYPEFETGLLYFAGYGDLSLIKCDLLLMEEETAAMTGTHDAHQVGKQVGVWTVNTEEGMERFLDSGVDLVITDHLLLASRVQDELDARSDLEVIFGRILGLSDLPL